METLERNVLNISPNLCMKEMKPKGVYFQDLERTYVTENLIETL